MSFFPRNVIFSQSDPVRENIQDHTERICLFFSRSIYSVDCMVIVSLLDPMHITHISLSTQILFFMEYFKIYSKV